MGSVGNTPCFYKGPLVSFALLLPLLVFMSSYSDSFTFSSIPVTVLVLVLSISLISFFSKSKRFQGSQSMEGQPEVEVSQETHQEIESLEPEGEIPYQSSIIKSPELLPGVKPPRPSPQTWDQIATWSDSSAPCDGPLQEAADQIRTSSDGSASDDGSSSPASVSISDDDSLIEIALPDGHPMRTGDPEGMFRPNLCGFLPEVSPELVWRQNGLVEVLSEINEEDNLIEIDISVGSIKCSRQGIKA